MNEVMSLTLFSHFIVPHGQRVVVVVKHTGIAVLAPKWSSSLVDPVSWKQMMSIRCSYA